MMVRPLCSLSASHSRTDWQCTLIMQDRGAIVTTETLEALANVMTEGPNTLTGTTFRLLIIYHQMAALIRHGRKQRLSSWNDENLIDTVTTAGHLEKLLEQEKERYQQLVNGECLSLCKYGCLTIRRRAWRLMSSRLYAQADGQPSRPPLHLSNTCTKASASAPRYPSAHSSLALRPAPSASDCWCGRV